MLLPRARWSQRDSNCARSGVYTACVMADSIPPEADRPSHGPPPSALVDAAVALARSLWKVYAGGHASASATRMALEHADYAAWERGYNETVDGEPLAVEAVLLAKLREADWIRHEASSVEISLDALRAPKLIGAHIEVLAQASGSTSELRGRHADIDYFMWRNIRWAHGIQYTPRVARAIHSLTEEMNLSQGLRDEQGRVHFTAVEAQLLARLQQDHFPEHRAQHYLSLFIECCLAVGYLQPRYGRGTLQIKASRFDADYLLSKLFGLPSQIKGFDDLFGGGGVMLPEAVPGASSPPRGRAIMIKGRFGTGKTSLALALATEVARKGGLAWIMPLEQSVEDCKHYLQGTGATDVEVSDDVASVVSVLTERSARETVEAERGAREHHPSSTGHQDRGAMFLLRTPRDDLASLLARIEDHARSVKGFALKLFVLDPLNAIVSANGGSLAALRQRLLQTVDAIRDTGASWLVVAEDDPDGAHTPGSRRWTSIVENIADTVIDLSISDENGYSQRYIEILKSRLQREQRGRHPFSIKSGSRLAIYPSPAAVATRVAQRSGRRGDAWTHFGWDPLDHHVLGEMAIAPADLIVLRGSSGTFRSQMGAFFLLQNEPGPGVPRASLLIPVRDSAYTARRLLEAPFIGAEWSRDRPPAALPVKKPGQVITLDLPGDFVQPGRILQAIEEAIHSARARGVFVDRAMIDDLDQWELTCPFIRDDPTFGNTLVDLLRSMNVTTLAICGPDEGALAMQRSIAHRSAVLIDFHRVEFAGTQRVMLRAIKSRSMAHRREAFEIGLSSDRLQLNESLLRVDRSGIVTVTRPQLYLHSGSSRQEQYNQDIRESLGPVLSTEVQVISSDRTHLQRSQRLGAFSVMDEVQVLQVDEFQLPELLRKKGPPHLHAFGRLSWSAEWNRMDHELRRRVWDRQSKTFSAVPYHDNVALLAFDERHLSQAQLASWPKLASLCQEWESNHKRTEELYFALPLATGEDYSCQFLEMAVAENLGLPSGPTDQVIAWFRRRELVDLCRIFWILVRRAHAIKQQEKLSSAADIARTRKRSTRQREKDGPRVGRYWYTALPDFLEGLDLEHRSRFKITSLPGGGLRGEWYLCVPAYSSAPYLGLEIIKALTSREAELERFRRGVGLPVRADFYRQRASSKPLAGSAPLSMPFADLAMDQIGAILQGAERRSAIPAYARISPILSFQLKRLLEIFPPGSDEPSPDTLQRAIEGVLSDLTHNIEFVLGVSGLNDSAL